MSFISVTSCFSSSAVILSTLSSALSYWALSAAMFCLCFLKKPRKPFFLVLVEVEALQLDNEVAELLAYLAHVLGAHLAERGAGEVGDVLLRGGAVVEYLLAVRHVYLLGELRDGGLLGAREALELELLGRDLLLLRALWSRRWALQAQRRGLGRGGVGVEGEGGDELLVFVHDILSFPVYY